MSVYCKELCDSAKRTKQSLLKKNVCAVHMVDEKAKVFGTPTVPRLIQRELPPSHNAILLFYYR